MVDRPNANAHCDDGSSDDGGATPFLDEMEALKQVGAALARLDPGARRRILCWATDKYVADKKEQKLHAAAAREDLSRG